MIPISVCLETVFTDSPAEERIARIAKEGFSHVEFWHPEATFDGEALRFDLPKDAALLRESARHHGVAINDFSFHAWDGSIGGSPVRAADREPYLEQVRRMIEFAKGVGCTKGITLSGIVDPSLSRSEMRASLERALSDAVELARDAGLTLLLEPLNTLVDHPGYYLDSFAEAAEIVRGFSSPHLRLLYDVYHMQIMRGNVIATIEEEIEWIGHFHSACVPGRGELFGGELHYPSILARIESLGYRGCFGLEYFPRIADHAESLRRVREYLGSA